MPTVNQQPETLTRKTSSTTFVIANKNEIKQSERSTYIDNPLPFDCCVGGSMTVPPAWPWWLSRAAALSKNWSGKEILLESSFSNQKIHTTINSLLKYSHSSAGEEAGQEIPMPNAGSPPLGHGGCSGCGCRRSCDRKIIVSIVNINN